MSSPSSSSSLGSSKSSASSPLLLAIETTTNSCAVGLSLENRILERNVIAAREHTRLLLPMIDSVLEEAGISLFNLQALACTIGPGSFTGVRIGAAVTQALSFASSKPVILISTLRAIAQQAYFSSHHSQVFANLAAGQGEIYGALFKIDEIGIMQACSEEKIFNPAQVVLPEGDWVSVQNLPEARSLLEIAQAEYQKGSLVSAEEIQPKYLGGAWS